MEPVARRRMLGALLAPAALLATAAVHASHFGRYFIRDELVWLDRVSHWSVADIIARSAKLTLGELGERPHVIGYLYVKALWAAFGAWYPGYALASIALHLTTSALVGWLAARLAPSQTALGPLSALVFGTWGASSDAGNFATVQHAALAATTAGLAIAYLGFLQIPTAWRAAVVVFLAGLAALPLESGPLAAATPILLEAARRWTPVGSRPRSAASEPARVALSTGAFLVGLPRLWHEAGALLLRGQTLDAAAPERYSVDLDVWHALGNLAYLVSETLGGVPEWAGVPFALLLAVGIAGRETRCAALFGSTLGLLLAAPFCAMIAPAPFHAYTPALGWAIAAAASVVAVGQLAGRRARAPWFRAAAAALLAMLLIRAAWLVRRHDAADGPAFAALRAVRAGLLDYVAEGGAPIVLVLQGVPTGRLHVDYPLMLQHALPVLVPGRRFQEVWVLAPAAREPLVIGDVHFTSRLPAELGAGPERVRAFAVRGARLEECAGVHCR